ncbi:ABC transporter G family member 41-like [Phragmites australis]|uniref:ABC transporter G family member 41-like n=1 Tax=Phragmites australis TaxID=29695 RepID=UPI002D79C6C5|nr:ABC transporter G family member 41-like [Phragmites australis]
MGNTELDEQPEKRSPDANGAVAPIPGGAAGRRELIGRLITHVEKDNRRLLQKMRDRMDRVDVQEPTIEVRFRDLSVEAECRVVQGKPLPTLWNSALAVTSVSFFFYYTDNTH